MILNLILFKGLKLICVKYSVSPKPFKFYLSSFNPSPYGNLSHLKIFRSLFNGKWRLSDFVKDFFMDI